MPGQSVDARYRLSRRPEPRLLLATLDQLGYAQMKPHPGRQPAADPGPAGPDRRGADRQRQTRPLSPSPCCTGSTLRCPACKPLVLCPRASWPISRGDPPPRPRGRQHQVLSLCGGPSNRRSKVWPLAPTSRSAPGRLIDHLGKRHARPRCAQRAGAGRGRPHAGHGLDDIKAIAKRAPPDPAVRPPSPRAQDIVATFMREAATVKVAAAKASGGVPHQSRSF